MRKNLIASLLLSILVWCVLVPELAGQAPRGSITGIITDSATGAPLALASVQIVGTPIKTATKSDGRYIMSNIPAGLFTLRVDRVAHKPIILTDVRVTAGETLVADFRMYQQSFIPGLVVTTGMVNPASAAREPWKPEMDPKAVRISLDSFERNHWRSVRVRAPAPERPTVRLSLPPLPARRDARPPGSPAPTSIWQYVYYPPVNLPRSANEQLTFLVGSGGHTNQPDQERSQLRFDILWFIPRTGAEMPRAIANPRNIVVRLHTADGRVVTPRTPFGWVGTGTGGLSQYSLINMFPWSRNALDEAWVEVRLSGQTWWVELPYGFARNPEDPEVPDRARGEPRFPRTMLPLGARDILVPWLAAEYEIGRTPDGVVLSVKLSNTVGARASVRLNPQPPNFTRLTLETPRIAVRIEAGRDTVAGRGIARRLHDGHLRTDDFSYSTDMQSGRAFGTITITIDGQQYGVRVPSSLFELEHGRTDYENKQWMVVPP